MTMTRQHFTLIARVLDKNRTDAELGKFNSHTPRQLMTAQALQWAEVLATTNENFDRQRFLNACGVTPEEAEANKVSKFDITKHPDSQ